MKRFITYLYEYNNGKKGTNTGFAKVDQRDDNVRLQLHLNTQGPGRRWERGTVYLLVSSGERQLEGLALGELDGRNREGSEMWNFPTQRILGSPYGIEDVVGIAVAFDSGRYMASSWVDETWEELSRGTFDIWGRQEIEPPSPQSGQEDLTRQPKEQPETQRPPRQTEQSEEKPEAQRPVEQPMEQPEVKRPVEQSMEKPEAQRPMEQPMEQSETQRPPRQTEQSEEKPEAQRSMEQPMEQPEEVAEFPHAQNENGTTQQKRAGARLAAAAVPSATQVTTRRIDLSEVRDLPKSNWHLASNSFLLHGFFNYNYLLLIETNKGGRRRYYLGVPGVFEQAEQAMARLFCFNGFEAEEYLLNNQRTPEGIPSGTFGFWTYKLQM